MNKSIIVTNNFKGYHKFFGAPDSVGFLRNMHRHVFNVRTQVEVKHNEREIEFLLLQDEIEKFVKHTFSGEGSVYLEGILIGSCESLAESILKYMQLQFPERHVRIEVWEDNENGAIVEE